MHIYSHRGMQQQAPENTLAAYRCAIDHGYDIELDVQITKDGQLVCFHDWQLGRTAPGAGMLWGYTRAELAGLDAGRWFAERFGGERIPTLRQALELAKGTAHVAIEMKMPGIDAPLVDLIAELDMFAQVFVFDIPQDYFLPARLKALDPRLRVGRNFIAEHDFLSMEADGFPCLDVIMAITRSGWLTQDHVARAHARGLQVVDTGVHDREKMAWCRRVGIDGVCSDCPDVIATP
jgi:glycerophosphoryl diester phosphodiesterase